MLALSQIILFFSLFFLRRSLQDFLMSSVFILKHLCWFFNFFFFYQRNGPKHEEER